MYLTITLLILSFLVDDSIVCNKYPKLVILTFGFCFTQLAVKMLLKTITKTEEFNQDTLSNNLFFFMIILSVLLKPFLGVKILDTILILGFFLNLIQVLHYLNKLTLEMADILKIKRFTIQKVYNLN